MTGMNDNLVKEMYDGYIKTVTNLFIVTLGLKHLHHKYGLRTVRQ